MDYLSNAFSFDWRLVLIDFLRVAAAFLLAVPIGWERHKSERNLGLRTFPIVAMASCGFMLLIKDMPGANAETHARLIQGLIGGIGFIGGGAILKHGADVRGLATAASIWTTGAIGAAIAFGRAEIAVILSAIVFLTLRLLTPIAETDDYPERGDEEKQNDDDRREKD